MSGLASRLADDEQSAWAELYDATANSLFHYITTLTGDPDVTAEILQETFVRLFRTRERLRTVEDLKAFVFTVTRNEANRWLSTRARRPRFSELNEHLAWHAGDSQHEDTDLLHHAIAGLSVDQREVVHLKTYCEFTFAQIAEVLNLPVGTCTSRYRRALSTIRTTIQEQLR